jgi:hypothetical protein
METTEIKTNLQKSHLENLIQDPMFKHVLIDKQKENPKLKLAINIEYFGDTYEVVVGENQNGKFKEYARVCYLPIPERQDLIDLANRELRNYKKDIFNIFIEGEFYQ